MRVQDLPPEPDPPSPNARVFVTLVVESLEHTPHFRKEVALLVNSKPGYIFVQTDKPLYTPHQSVYIRVMTLNEAFRPMKWSVQVEIKNPDAMTISRRTLESQDLFSKDVLQIPENPLYGNWTVTAAFMNGLKTSRTVRFEVKEYVLPTFSVSFQIPESRRVILPNDTHFHMTVQAQYVYGKPVKGHVTVTYGLLWHGHVFTVGKQRNLQLNGTGQAECGITIQELQLPVQSVWFPDGGRLHVKAHVTELASGRVQRADDVSVVFSDHLYVLRFLRSPRFFKPGLPYVLEVDVLKANGDAGPNLPLNVECQVDEADVDDGDDGDDSNDSTETRLLHPSYREPGLPAVTDALGHLRVTYFVPPRAKTLKFKITPSAAREGSLSTYHFHARRFYSPSGVYMQVHADITDPYKRGMKPKVGDYISVTSTYTSAEDITTVSLVVISRGRIVWQVSTKNILGNMTAFHFTLTQDMTPGSRLLTFATRGNEPGAEIISDSVWMDIDSGCDGEVGIKREDMRRKILRPGDVGTVTLSGPPHTTIGLVAVDSAVYHMRNSSFTRAGVFDEMLKHDRGCGSGGGRDAGNVFESAGLSVLTNAGLDMETKKVEGCADKRVKRSTHAVNKAKEICCQEGYQLRNASLELCYFASQELIKMIGSRLCAQEFFDCCRDNVQGRQAQDASSRLTAMEDKLPEALEMSFDEERKALGEIPLRTNFPESWWFEEYNLGPEGKVDVDFVLPDSITTWTVQAVGMSQEAGLCVAPPLHVTAFRNFFVQVDLPYSVVRLEQVEARATIYNYLPRTLRVRLALESEEGICYSGEPGKMTELVRLEIPPHDASSAYFPIVPLEIGEFPIRVMAFSAWGQDAVEKTLRVEGEGLEKIHTISVMLDPSGKRFLRNRSSNHSFHIKNEVKVDEKRQSVELDLDLPQEMVPDTDSCTVHAMGDLLGPTLNVVIEDVAEILRLPTGCGEQNLIYLAPNVYVTRYLRATRRLSSELEKKALAVIRQGVMRQMTFRKPNFSFATWQHADASTWLTAFAMKTLCQAEHFVTIDHNQTCASLTWLERQQNLDGSFQEMAWVTHREMLGGVNGDISHSAYILIALLECECPGKDHDLVVSRAIEYLAKHTDVADRPLAVAISAYALTLAGHSEGDRLFERLKETARSSPEGFTYWNGAASETEFGDEKVPYWYQRKPGALAVEVTSYALLTYLARGDISTATSIVGWLLQQRNSHGAFVSTQDTVVGLQALSEYSIKSYSAILDMTCHISSEVDDRFRRSISLTPEDAMVLKSVPKVPTGGKLHFEAEGTGVGLMQVEVRFNVPDDEMACRYDVKVSTHQQSSLLQSFFGSHKRSKCEPCSVTCVEEEDEDYADYDDEVNFEDFVFPSVMPRILSAWNRKRKTGPLHSYGGEYQGHEKDQPIEHGHLFGSRIGRPVSRVTRSTQAFSSNVFCMEICLRFLGERTTGMSIVDAGLLTGYAPVEEDLQSLKAAGKIDHYEKSKRSVVLYIDQVSSDAMTCVKFRARQDHMAQNIQPAKVQVFDYYSPDDRCTVFYKGDNRSGELVNFCDDKKQICQCLESRCSFCEESWQGLRWSDMVKYACTNASYVLEIKTLDRDLEKVGFERVLGEVVKVNAQKGHYQLKPGDKVILLKRASCICPRLAPQETYLMMLTPPKRFRDANGNLIYAFLLDKRVMTVHQVKHLRGLMAQAKNTARNIRRTVRRLRRRGCTPGRVRGQDKSKEKGKDKNTQKQPKEKKEKKKRNSMFKAARAERRKRMKERREKAFRMRKKRKRRKRFFEE
ncbi:hypothetical protein EGW08_005027 [Elysia chlorotica]|uniref:NTR domain-containing protein n=1 Tax=Elysia chlorotica TaxID=188477 RepID=A0A433U040_ELYCH|nr:hypothetical protein EGW08_005027 [Elysia chlorotica]